jgi:Na+/proline symporter
VSWAVEPLSILFDIALAGFMPNPLDASVCQSMWVAEAEKILGEGNSSELRQTRRAFLSAYVMTALLAVCFCIMDAGVMHSDAILPESSAATFAAQVINLYSSALGEGAGALAAIAALSVMLSTLMMALDITSRNVASTYQEVFAKPSAE